ncbi:hypothetical protein TIFTF001_013409 [Ficus carica]|uniref:Uncharacterized protein n=1 Tax=Ficus carica TaxID=3494 RepID=A0AA87ZUW4_FICCA|nr:hypothetical protein TIFTF001_013409 [Ficus carica]
MPSSMGDNIDLSRRWVASFGHRGSRISGGRADYTYSGQIRRLWEIAPRPPHRELAGVDHIAISPASSTLRPSPPREPVTPLGDPLPRELSPANHRG